MTVRTQDLRLRSGFTFDDSAKNVHLSLPITPWLPSVTSIGGDIESDAGVRASFIICQRETLGLTLRFFEDQWKDIQDFIETVQDGMPFTWTPDPTYRNYPEYTDIILDGPAVGTKFAATPDPQFPRVLQLPIVLARLGCSLFNMKEIPSPPQFAIFNGDGLLHVTNVYGTVSLLYSAVGGGGKGNGSGGGGGGASYGTFEASVGTIFVHVGKGSYATMTNHGEDSTINYPGPHGGPSGDAGAQGGNPAFGDNGGGSGGGQDPDGHGTGGYHGGSGVGVGFAGSPAGPGGVPPAEPAYGAGGGGGGGGAGGIGTDAIFTGPKSVRAGDGGPPGATFHGAGGGGGGGGSDESGAGSASDGTDGGGAGQGGHGNTHGHDGLVVVEWMLGELVAVQEI